MKAGDIVYIVGFGRTLNSKRSQIKQKLAIPIFDQRRCIEKFASKNVDINVEQICAGGREFIMFVGNYSEF